MLNFSVNPRTSYVVTMLFKGCLVWQCTICLLPAWCEQLCACMFGCTWRGLCNESIRRRIQCDFFFSLFLFFLTAADTVCHLYTFVKHVHHVSSFVRLLYIRTYLLDMYMIPAAVNGNFECVCSMTLYAFERHFYMCNYLYTFERQLCMCVNHLYDCFIYVIIYTHLRESHTHVFCPLFPNGNPRGDGLRYPVGRKVSSPNFSSTDVALLRDPETWCHIRLKRSALKSSRGAHTN